MIQSFRDAATKDLFLKGRHRDFAAIAKVAVRKLDQIAAAVALDELKEPPGNRVEALKGGRAGQHSVSVNDQFRICFEWRDDGPHEVEIIDYH